MVKRFCFFSYLVRLENVLTSNFLLTLIQAQLVWHLSQKCYIHHVHNIQCKQLLTLLTWWKDNSIKDFTNSSRLQGRAQACTDPILNLPSETNYPFKTSVVCHRSHTHPPCLSSAAASIKQRCRKMVISIAVETIKTMMDIYPDPHSPIYHCSAPCVTGYCIIHLCWVKLHCRRVWRGEDYPPSLPPLLPSFPSLPPPCLPFPWPCSFMTAVMRCRWREEQIHRR